MNRQGNTGIVVLVILLVISLLIGGAAISSMNGFAKSENALTAEWAQMQNQRSNAYQQIKTSGRIVQQEQEAFERLMQGVIEGRYAGGNALMVWEQSEMSRGVELSQDLLDVARSTLGQFTAEQARFASMQQSYANSFTTFPGSMWAGMFGYPSDVSLRIAPYPMKDRNMNGVMDWTDVELLLGEDTKREFSTGIAETIDPFAD